MWRAFKQILSGCLLTSIFTIVLFSNQASNGDSFLWFGKISYEVQMLCQDSYMQWAVIACLVTHFVIFLLVQQRISLMRSWWQWSNVELWLCGLVMLALICFVFNQEAATSATRLLILLVGITLGKAAGLWVGWAGAKFRYFSPSEAGWNCTRRLLGITFVLLLLLAAAAYCPAMAIEYQYRGQLRWKGPWDNPNIFGLFMGVGISLTLGLLVQSLKFNVQAQKAQNGVRCWKFGVGRYAITGLCLLTTILMNCGLLHSYSRGAWFGTGCGLTYLAVCKFIVQGSRFRRWICSNAVSLVVIAASIVVLTFWHFDQTEWSPARRAFSVVNMNDFSWRNRSTAWEGALQITAEHPWFGVGWNQTETLYEYYYAPSKLSESGAIEMNDYLILGATLGVPALFCFGMYIWLCLGNGSWKLGDSKQQTEAGIQNSKSATLDFRPWTLDSIQTTCRAGAIVLLVGFWFDGGLFKLPTAATFWILLELSSVQFAQSKSPVSRNGQRFISN